MGALKKKRPNAYKNNRSFQQKQKGMIKVFQGQKRAVPPDGPHHAKKQKTGIEEAVSPSPVQAGTKIKFHKDENASKRLLAKPGIKWYEQVTSEPENKSPPRPDLVTSLKQEAESILKDDCEHYKKFLELRKERSDFTWMKTIIRSGTLSDKISAHMLLIQDSPVNNINSLEILIGMVNTKGKRECLMAVDSLKDLFLSDLLPENRKLKAFSQQPLEELDELSSHNIRARRKLLLFWYFEDQLKILYSKFVKSLEAVSRDTIEKTKQKAVTVICELLKDSPEQEQFLLEILVNKIGDPIPKVGSHVCYLLGQLVSRHKNMIAVVIQEVERLLFRPNVTERAKYYCLCFYSQLILNNHQSNIANHLISIYFALFKACIKKGEVNTKMMSALLTGVSRAYPYAKLKNNVMMEQLDAMFRLVHMVSFNISVQALMLIFQVLDSKDSLSDRFYCALYRKLLDPAINSSSRQAMLLNLLYRALKKDVAKVRVKAFTKRLIQVALYQAPNFQCGILMLVSNLLRTHPDLLQTNTNVLDSDSESEEHFEDITDAEDSDKPLQEKPARPPNATSASSWVHRENKPSRVRKKYDPQSRNPLHAGADFCSLWEMQFLKNSFHPSVTLFAHQVLNGQDVNYSGDPLQDFTLIRFLDRFVYRNPKKQPQSTTADVHRKVFGKRIASRSETQQVAVTDDHYIKQTEEKVPVEEHFIYRYLKQRVYSGKKSGHHDSDIESVASDEFEALLNQIHPEDEGRDTLDFAKELSLNKRKPRKEKSTRASDDESDDDMESLAEESDFEDDLEQDEEFAKAFEEFDDIEKMKDTQPSEDSLSEDEVVSDQHHKKRKNQKNETSLFASADEFSTMLEDSAATGIADATSTEAFINYDNSSAKQLVWERQRDQYVRGADWKSRKKFGRRKPVNKKGKRS